jgi:hypothetical protein
MRPLQGPLGGVLLKSIILVTVMAIGLTLTSAPCIAANKAHCRNYANWTVSQDHACVYGADWRWNANWTRLCNWCLAEVCFRNLTLRESKLLLYGRYYV